MDETELEKLARLSGKATSKALGALEPRGYDARPVSKAPLGLDLVVMGDIGDPFEDAERPPGAGRPSRER
jgi:hypothetical protein